MSQSTVLIICVSKICASIHHVLDQSEPSCLLYYHLVWINFNHPWKCDQASC